MEKLTLSTTSNLALNLSSRNSLKIRCLNLSRASGFKGFRVSSQLRVAGRRDGLRVGGWRDDVPLRKTFIVAASLEESASTDLQVEGKVVEGLKDTNSAHEATTWNGEKKEVENSDTKPFDSLRNSVEELQRELDKAKESLAEVSKEATGKEENKPQVTEDGPIQEPKKAAKIHDFCFGIPYGGLLIGVGLLGFLISGSINSVLCFVAGGAVLGLSLTSLKVWRQGKSCTPFISRQAAFSFLLLAGHLREFSLTKVVFPTGFTAVISALMLSFYVYVYASGGNPPSKKLKASSVSQVA
ncbi:hypothetical protein KI387_001688 [Taxus chinensis]|uniref:Uncharacterized protein n=1 Tax=Taxus chinensis TaxID=29808 RepID=A0AA38GZR7_TAXCH|nr:hypothetical protein KI387_001688 [Taxus chinensis]